MARVITTLAAEDGTAFDDICSFETMNYIGIWNHTDNCFMLIEKMSAEFHPYAIIECDNLEELDREVFAMYNEHIKEVYTENAYTFRLNKKEF